MKFFEMNQIKGDTTMGNEKVGSAKNAVRIMLANVERQLLAGRTAEGQTDQESMAGLRREQERYMAELAKS